MSTITTPEPDLYSPTAERELNAAILADSSTGPHVSGMVIPAAFGDDLQREIAGGIWQLMELGRPITRATILAALDKADDRRLSIELQRLHDSASLAVIEAAPTNAERIMHLARVRQSVDILGETRRRITRSPDELNPLLDLMGDDLARATTGQRLDQNSHVSAIKDEENAELGTPFGLRWLDNPEMIGGLAPSEKVLIQGVYGGRKTATAIFLTTQLTRKRAGWRRNQVSYFFLDDNKQVLRRWYIAQLATAWLRKNGVAVEEWNIKARGLHKSLRTPSQQDAIEWAESYVNQMPLYLYDGTDDIADLDTLLAIAKRDVLRYYAEKPAHGEQQGMPIIVIDYLQDVMVKGAKPGIFDQMYTLTQRLKRFGTRYRAAQIWLAQQTEVENSSVAEMGVNTKAGTKGGGDAPSAANYVIRNIYNSADPEQAQYLRMQLVKSRWSGRDERVYKINPASGLFLDPDKE